MAILYKKPIKAQAGSYIYESVNDLAKDPRFKDINLYSKSGVTRCLGSALDAGKVCGYDYRPVFGKSFPTAARVKGDNDNVVDAWDVLNAANNTDELEVIYDRARDGAITEGRLKRIPLHALIGTGNVAGKYGVSADIEGIVSSHALINLGYNEKGEPLIYDRGKITAGIQAKYLNSINYILVPKGKHTYFKAPSTQPEESGAVPPEDIQLARAERKAKKKTSVELIPTQKSDYLSSFLSLLKDTFNVT